MFEILLLLAIMIGAARRRGSGRRRAFNLRPVRFSANSGDLSTLASVTAIRSTLIAAPVGSSYRVVSVKATWSVVPFTAGDGPLILGISHGDYTITQIKEFIEATGSIDLGDKQQQEKANRLIRIVGTVSSVSDSTLNDGRPIKTKLNWKMTQGKALSFFVYNDGAGALTTGSFNKVNGTAWVVDT